MGSREEIIVSLAAAISLGTLITAAARTFRLPAAFLLLAAGVALGPEGLNLIRLASLQAFLPALVSIAVAIILFEGGLTLDLEGFKADMVVIRRLVTLGVLVTWFGAAACIRLVLDVELPFALLAGSLVIVTSPTVIIPLLRRARLQPRLHRILHWEAVLTNPIGVLCAILCFDWVIRHAAGQALFTFFLRVLTGTALGFAGGALMYALAARRLVPEQLRNVFWLATAVLVFGATEYLYPEAGLLAATVAGLFLAWKQPGDLHEIKKFKSEITELLIGTLFLLLAGRLNLERVADFGLPGLAAVALAIVMVRPVNVLLCGWKTGLTWRERVFLSWIAPRGVVAASMASLFALQAEQLGYIAQARVFELFTYSVIIATVTLQGISASPAAQLLGLRRPDPTGWLIVGGHRFGCDLARLLAGEFQVPTAIIDTNQRHVREARDQGLEALHADALESDLAELYDRVPAIGNLLALTDNAELNELLCQHWAELLGPSHVFRWSPQPGGSASPRHYAGAVFGTDLPYPSVIAGELDAGDSQLLVVPAAEAAGLSDALPLFRRRGRELLVATPENGGARQRPDEKLAVLLRASGLLSQSLENGDVLDVHADSLEDLCGVLAAAAARRCPGISEQELAGDLRQKNHALLPYLGGGVALPHIYDAAARRRVCIAARLARGLVLPDAAEPIRLVFFVISPPDDPKGHLATLAAISRFCVQERHRRALLEAAGAPAMKAYLRAHCER